MNALIVPLTAVRDQTLTVEAVVTEADLRPGKDAELHVGPVRLAGRLTEIGARYLFHGRLSGAFLRVCDRCLEDAAASFDIEVDWAFEQGPALRVEADEDTDEDDEEPLEDEPDVTRFEADEIDLRPRLWEELVLSAPTKVLCEEGCAGLCPECGANLNRETCGCDRAEEKETLENRGLAGLKDLFPHLDPDTPKE